ncbi:hypothetical protein FH972_023002 [Carpinus fangiana]|uniref:Major facilitator superfamily (MFS) profile domain-containing protein n=1 Tax=Carpinus fangiana TaxID=176857 RepID=A0A5N6KTX1_9ROSI|nr:hypothetical protein FH972_023002 [Carpinus fangiana]
MSNSNQASLVTSASVNGSGLSEKRDCSAMPVDRGLNLGTLPSDAPQNNDLEQVTKEESPTDPNLVSWDGPDDPENPKNWPMRRKWTAALIVSAFTLISPVLALYMAFLYGICYLVLATFPTLWTSPLYYNMNIGVGSLNYIALALGFFLGAQITAPLSDSIYRKLKTRNNGVDQPEFRCPVMLPGGIMVPIGLLWYGWSAEMRVHWIMPDIGTVIFSAGIIVGYQSIQTYIVDSYTRFAASGSKSPLRSVIFLLMKAKMLIKSLPVAAAMVLRSLAGFAFPLFAPYMYKTLGYGWGNSTLAFIAIVIGIPAPILLWKFGPLLRSKSRFAAGA